MNDISKRFEQLVVAAQKKLTASNNILPVKTQDGILVGDVLIKSNGSLKDLVRDDEIVFKEISLNEVAIRLANLLATRHDIKLCEKIYRLDQDYGKWFQEWQLFKQKYARSVKSKEYERADMFLAKYEDAKFKAENAKQSVILLIRSE